MKPNGKQIMILNLVNNIPMAIVMSTAAPLLARQPIQLAGWVINVLIAFVLACLINMIFPIPKMAMVIPEIFKLEPKSFAGRLVANIPIALLFVLIIGLLLNLYNVRMVPAFLFAFLETFLPLYLICFVIAMITNPVAEKLAFGSPERS